MRHSGQDVSVMLGARTICLSVLLLLGACGDDDTDLTATTTTAPQPVASTVPPDLAGEDVIEDDRCDPAVAVLNDDAYGLMAVTEDLDVGSGPSDSVDCTFALVGRQPQEGEVIAQTFEVTSSGEVIEGEPETFPPNG